MKYLSIALLFILPISIFADKAVQPARSGKFGGIHPNAWRLSTEPEQKGEGKEYLFEVSIYKNNTLCDSFNFTLNLGAKNTKKSQFSIKGDLDSEKFGTELSLEFLEISKDGESLDLNISLNTKYIEGIFFKDNVYLPLFFEANIDEKISLNTKTPFIISSEEKIFVKIKAEEKI